MNKKVKLDKGKNFHSAHVHALSHDGRGIATIENKTTFIAGALPDETITCQLTRKRSHYNEAELVSVTTPSPKRLTPICEHFGICGGCSLQHMDMAMQMGLKQQTLLDQLKHFGRVTPASLLAPLSAETLGYRRKARLGVKFVIKKDKLFIGFREKSSRYLADIEHCPVLHPSIGEHLSDLKKLINTLDMALHLPQIEVAVGEAGTALIFRHLVPLSPSDQSKLSEFGRINHFDIYSQPNPPAKLTKVWPLDQPDRLTYTLPDEELTFLFHPLDFTQVNFAMNRLMVNQALTLLDIQKNETVLDLFCGAGNFTLPIARRAAHATGIEHSAEMVSRANENAHFNRLDNVDFFAADLEKPSAEARWLKTYDKLLLDPPRAGAKEILSFTPRIAAKRIVYVSCNPATLARDAGMLVNEFAYVLTHAGIMNMFPHTAHIEAMAVFEKK